MSKILIAQWSYSLEISKAFQMFFQGCRIKAGNFIKKIYLKSMIERQLGNSILMVKKLLEN